MKYVAIVTYAGGETTGAIIEAEARDKAWKKLFRYFGAEFHVQSATLKVGPV